MTHADRLEHCLYFRPLDGMVWTSEGLDTAAPATRGCILQLVRDAHACSQYGNLAHAAVQWIDGRGLMWAVRYPTRVVIMHYITGWCDSEIEALTRALEMAG